MNKTCKYYGKCGGCQTPNLSYPEQLSMKMRKMISTMGRYCHVDEIRGMENPYHYRTKTQAAFVRAGGSTLCGLYQSSSGRVIPAKSCLLEDEEALRIRRTVENLAHSLRLTVYNPKNGRGLLRHVMVRVSRSTSQAMVLLVTGSSPFTKAKAFTEALIAACPNIMTIVQCINTTEIPLWTGGRQNILYGSGFMEEIIGGCRFRVSATSFLQVNPVQTERLYQIALQDAALTGRESVLDAYCGVGALGILAAPMAIRVTGVEINESSIADANENASMNSITNIRFYAADAAEYIKNQLRRKEKADVVFLDPPRAGCSREFLQSLIRLAPERIVYISCNPETLARDVGMLVHNHYVVQRVTPVDMFPFTTHIETVCLLTKVKKGGGKP